MVQHMHKDQRTTCRSHFAPSTPWNLGIKPRSLGLESRPVPYLLSHLTGPYFVLRQDLQQPSWPQPHSEAEASFDPPVATS